MFHWIPKPIVTPSEPSHTDLKNFLARIGKWSPENAYDLTRTGLKCLKTFPASRDAVLDYFGVVFHEAVTLALNNVDELESDSDEYSCLESANMIGRDLCVIGRVWAPIISNWCIKVVMSIATNTQTVPYGVLLLKKPVRVLLDITTENLTLLSIAERAKHIDIMLGSRVCSWVVGWVGRVEPVLVAPRALTLTVDGACAVLAPLAGHGTALYHVKASLLDLFKEAIKDNAKARDKREIIPYILNLAGKSEIVLKAITQDVEKTLTEDTIKRLMVLCPSQRYTRAWQSVTPASILSLLVRSNAGCFLLLLKCARKYDYCRQMLERLLQKLEHECLYPDRKFPIICSAAYKVNVLRDMLHSESQFERVSVARMLILVCRCAPSDIVGIISYLVQYSRSDIALALLVRIVSGTMRMHTPQANTRDIHMRTDTYHNFVKTGVEYALRDSKMADMEIKKILVQGPPSAEEKTYVHHFCMNTTMLMRWENSNQMPHLRSKPFTRAVQCNLQRIGAALLEYSSILREKLESTWYDQDLMKTCHALAQLMDRIDVEALKARPPSVEAILTVVQATVNYIFRCMHLEDLLDKVRGVQVSGRVLQKLCVNSEFARAVAIRTLLETALFREDKLFGSRVVVPDTVVQTQEWTEDELLMHQNRKYGPLTQLTQSHTSVFHAGIIGKVRKEPIDSLTNPPILTANNELLMGALMSCMNGHTGVTAESATSLTLLLMEMVSPDVMYNGLSWPDEDFTKQVSIERELYMSGALQNCSVARSVLRRVAAVRPSLCHASALLRAPAASTLHRLRACGDQDSQSSEVRRELSVLAELLTTMTLGQLLPHPLSHMLELVPLLTAGEAVEVLSDCLWNYTRDNVPAPSLFPRDSSGLYWRDPSTCTPSVAYTDTLRIIIQKRISKLGHMYPIMFLDLENNPDKLTEEQDEKEAYKRDELFPGCWLSMEDEPSPGCSTDKQYEKDPVKATDKQDKPLPGFSTDKQYEKYPVKSTDKQDEPLPVCSTDKQYEKDHVMETDMQDKKDPGKATDKQHEPLPVCSTDKQDEKDLVIKTFMQDVKDSGKATDKQDEKDLVMKTDMQDEKDSGKATDKQDEKELVIKTYMQDEKDSGKVTDKQDEKDPVMETDMQDEKDPGKTTDKQDEKDLVMETDMQDEKDSGKATDKQDEKDPVMKTDMQDEKDPGKTTVKPDEKDPGKETDKPDEKDPGKATDKQGEKDPGKATDKQDEKDPAMKTDMQDEKDPGKATDKQDEKDLVMKTNMQDEKDSGKATDKQDEKDPGKATDKQDEEDPVVKTDMQDEKDSRKVTDEQDEKDIVMKTDMQDEKNSGKATDKKDKKDPGKATDKQDEKDPLMKTDMQDEKDPGKATDKQDEKDPLMETDMQDKKDPGMATDKQDEKDPVMETDMQDEKDPGKATDKQNEKDPEIKTDMQDEKDPGKTTDKQDEKDPGKETDKQDEKDPLMETDMQDEKDSGKATEKQDEKDPVMKTDMQDEKDPGKTTDKQDEKDLVMETDMQDEKDSGKATDKQDEKDLGKAIDKQDEKDPGIAIDKQDEKDRGKATDNQMN